RRDLLRVLPGRETAADHSLPLPARSTGASAARLPGPPGFDVDAVHGRAGMAARPGRGAAVLSGLPGDALRLDRAHLFGNRPGVPRRGRDRGLRLVRPRAAADAHLAEPLALRGWRRVSARAGAQRLR